MQSEELLTRMYEDIKIIRSEVEKIHGVLISEVEPSAEELAEIEAGLREVEEGKVRSWERIKGEIWWSSGRKSFQSTQALSNSTAISVCGFDGHLRILEKNKQFMEGE